MRFKNKHIKATYFSNQQVLIIIIMIIYLFKQTQENISNGDSEQDRKAQSALTTAPKETKYRYNNATQLMKFS